jgi:hypothetical protein
MHWLEPNFGLDLTFKFSIDRSAVEITCEGVRVDEEDQFVLIYIRAYDIVQAAVNLIAFAMAQGLYVILETVERDGQVKYLINEDRGLASLCTAFKMGPAPNPNLDAILKIVLGTPNLFSAIKDLIEAIREPHVGAVNCARAIERIRHLSAAPGSSRAHAWKQLRHNLGIEQEYLEFVTSYSPGPRHGDPQHIPGNIASEITLRAWTIMNRFLEFRMRGDQPLPSSEFPILSN